MVSFIGNTGKKTAWNDHITKESDDVFRCHGEDGGKIVFKWSQVVGMHQAKKKKKKMVTEKKNVLAKASKDYSKISAFGIKF